MASPCILATLNPRKQVIGMNIFRVSRTRGYCNLANRGNVRFFYSATAVPHSPPPSSNTPNKPAQLLNNKPIFEFVNRYWHADFSHNFRFSAHFAIMHIISPEAINAPRVPIIISEVFCERRGAFIFVCDCQSAR
jgi:hypothetical protein